MSEEIKLPYKIKERYSTELNNIQEILTNMENGNIYGYNGNVCRMDGTLQHNSQKLRKEIASLLSKIENGSDSIEDEIAKAFIWGEK